MIKKLCLLIGFILAFSSSPIFAGTDTAETPWVSVNNGLPRAYSLTYDQIALYAGTERGVYKSTNGGQTWELASNGLPNKSVTSLTYDAYGIVAGIKSYGIYKSIDGGKTWQQINKGLPAGPDIQSVYWGGTDTIYTSIYKEGVFKSTDAGQSWQKANNGMPVAAFYSPISGRFTHDSQSGVYYSSMYGIYNTKNKGENWQRVSTGLPNPAVIMTALGYDGNTLYTAQFIPNYPVSAGAAFKSSDKAKTWQKMSGISFWDKQYEEFSMVTSFWGDNSVVYAGTTLFGIYKSTNKGASWVLDNEGITSSRHLSADAFVSDGKDVFVATDVGIYKKPLQH